MTKRFISFLIFTVFLAFAPAAHAACTSPAAAEGSLEWDSTLKRFKYCNNTVWLYLSSGRPIFRGFTTSGYTGATVGGIKGAHAKCNTDFAGSRAMTYDDYLKLGTDYTYAQNAWLMDGSFLYWNGTDTLVYQAAKGGDPGGGGAFNSSNATEFMCAQWTTASGTRSGPYVTQTGGGITLGSCNNSFRLACVQD